MTSVVKLSTRSRFFAKKSILENTNPLLIFTWFLKNQVVKIHFNKPNFAGYTGSKNPVWNRLKIQFIELDFSKLIFQKSSRDQQGGCHSISLYVNLTQVKDLLPLFSWHLFPDFVSNEMSMFHNSETVVV